MKGEKKIIQIFFLVLQISKANNSRAQRVAKKRMRFFCALKHSAAAVFGGIQRHHRLGHRRSTTECDDWGEREK